MFYPKTSFIYLSYGIKPPKSYFSADEQSELKSGFVPVVHPDPGLFDVS